MQITDKPARVTVPMVWRDTLQAFSANSASILTGAVLGFAIAAVLAALAGAYVTLESYARTSTILITYGPSRIIPLLVEGVIGLPAAAYARGVISWRILHPDQPIRTRSVLRAVWPFWFTLLVSTLIISGLFFAGNAGLNAMLTEQGLDLADVGQLSATANGMVHSIILRTIGSLIPDPGAPFAQLLSYMRLESSRLGTSLVYAGGLSYYYVKNIQEIPLSWLYGAGGLALLLSVDVLHRFVVAAIILTPGPGSLRRVGAAIMLAVRHFGLVLAHIWLVRLVVFTVSTVFITAPIVLTQSILVPLLIRSTGAAWPYLVSTVILAISIAFVSMVLLAFGIVYDACLYRRLHHV